MTREEAIKYIKAMNDTLDTLSENQLMIALDMAIEALKEPKQGEWIWKFDEKTGITGWHCSECGYPHSQVYSIYCSVCGAKMKNPTETEGDEK